MSKMTSRFAVAIALFLFTTFSLQAGKISAYYDAPYADASTVKSKLKKAGFTVLTTYSPAGKSYLKVLVFTNEKLKSIESGKAYAMPWQANTTLSYPIRFSLSSIS